MKSFYLLVLSASFFGTADAQFNVIHDFNGAAGAYGSGSLTQSGDMFYGMTNGGGASGDGCVFSMDTSGNNYTDMLDFANNNFPDGRYPEGSLILIGNKLFGMDYNGGATGDGVIFTINTNGTGYKEIFNFNFADYTGTFPYGNLLYANNLLYGMTSASGVYDRGNIFAIDTGGNNFKDLHDFDTVAKGLYGLGSLTLSGNMFYGMAANGGASDSGIIFSMDTLGYNYKVIHDFGGAGGGDPQGTLTLLGNILYGMTINGGKYGGGILFSIDTLGNNFTNIHNFNDTMGNGPFGDVLLVGNVLYGMTSYGGITHDSGVAFSVHTDGSHYTVLNYFNGSNGANPKGDLLLLKGRLYGMTVNGGLDGDGVIFGVDTSSITNSIDVLSTTSIGATVYPNPSNGIFSVDIKNMNGTAKTIKVYNVLGELVYQTGLSAIITQINIGVQAAGIYLYRVLQADGNLVGEGKMSVE